MLNEEFNPDGMSEVIHRKCILEEGRVGVRIPHKSSLPCDTVFLACQFLRNVHIKNIFFDNICFAIFIKCVFLNI